MCGIVALSCSEPCANETALKRALKAIEHRGPDGYGYWVSSDGKKALGNVRLAIIDPRDEGLQPMVNEDGRVIVVLNGEIYNYKDLKKELEKKHEFLTNTDTEVLLHAYEEWGFDVVHRLRGMFAFVIYDERKDVMFAARDHVGKKPLFLYKGKNVLALASEPSAFKAMNLALHRDELAPFYMFSYVSPPKRRTFYSNVEKVLNGEYLIVKNGEVLKRKRYYEFKFEGNELDLRRYAKRLFDELVKAVRYRLIADVPISIALSSGVDSTLLAAVVTKELKRDDVAAFTVSGFGEYDESELASAVAEELGLSHTIVDFKMSDYIRMTYELTSKIGLPITDPSLVLGYGIASAARKVGFKVMLVGEGGDELFMGYPVYERRYEAVLTWASLPLYDLALWLFPMLRGLAPNALCYATILKLCTARNNAFGSHMCKLSTLERSLEAYVYLTRALESDAGPRNLAERMLSYEYVHRIPDHLTLKVDLYSMAASVEARAPYLDYKLIETAMSLSPVLKRYIIIKHRKLFGKLFLRRYLSEKLWEKVVSRKIGFGQQVTDFLLRIAVEEAPETLRRSKILKEHIDVAEFERVVREDPKKVSYLAWLVFAYGVWEEVMGL